ncbi:MAG: hypothetical protein JJU05_18635 [Verrucomicrobia bacterium]|nr:hypothetical protein [Verrucomicrobiota bacterium]MCH8528248.1 hypothetical protein [Kiritimatiellia bacterium]
MKNHKLFKQIRCVSLLVCLLYAAPASAGEQSPGTLILISSLGGWTLFGLIPWLVLRIRKVILARSSANADSGNAES